MDRRVLFLALCVSACADSEIRFSENTDVQRAVLTKTGLAETTSDAALEPDAEPTPGKHQVLHGSAAELAIASGSTVENPSPANLGPADPELLIDSQGVGHYRLDMVRKELLGLLRKNTLPVKRPTTPGSPSVEMVVLRGQDNQPLLSMRIYAGRLAEILVLARDPRAVTERGIHVGSSYDEAIRAHGEPRLVTDDNTHLPLGWVLEDLPGVVFAPLARAQLRLKSPPSKASIGLIRVMGPAAIAPDD